MAHNIHRQIASAPMKATSPRRNMTTSRLDLYQCHIYGFWWPADKNKILAIPFYHSPQLVSQTKMCRINKTNFTTRKAQSVVCSNLLGSPWNEPLYQRNTQRARSRHNTGDHIEPTIQKRIFSIKTSDSGRLIL